MSAPTSPPSLHLSEQAAKNQKATPLATVTAKPLAAKVPKAAASTSAPQDTPQDTPPPPTSKPPPKAQDIQAKPQTGPAKPQPTSTTGTNPQAKPVTKPLAKPQATPGKAAKEPFLGYEEGAAFARQLNLKVVKDWETWSKSGARPANIPSNPSKAYKDRGWQGWGHFLGTGKPAKTRRPKYYGPANKPPAPILASANLQAPAPPPVSMAPLNPPAAGAQEDGTLPKVKAPVHGQGRQKFLASTPFPTAYRTLVPHKSFVGQTYLLGKKSPTCLVMLKLWLRARSDFTVVGD